METHYFYHVLDGNRRVYAIDSSEKPLEGTTVREEYNDFLIDILQRLKAIDKEVDSKNGSKDNSRTDTLALSEMEFEIIDSIYDIHSQRRRFKAIFDSAFERER